MGNLIHTSLMIGLSISLAACGGKSDAGRQEPIASEKIQITTLDDLPRTVYEIDRPASELLMSDDFGELTHRVRKDVADILAKYDIQDTATRRSLFDVIRRIEFLDGNYENALAWMEKSRNLEEKEANRLTAGLTLEAWVAAHEVLENQDDPEAFNSAFSNELAREVSELPWETIQDNIEQTKGMAELISSNLLQGIVQSEIDPMVAKTGVLTEGAARRLIGMRYTMEMFIPVKDGIAATYAALITENKVVKPDIWAERSVVLDANSSVQPIVVGIWDTGVDAVVFGDSMWANPGETFDGTDTDGNGFVDDVHGIAFDVDGLRSPHVLLPEGDMAGRVDEAMNYVKGFRDLISSIDSDESTHLKRHVSNLQPESVKSFMTALNFAADYMHGTHVAGIAVEGNSFARPLIARTSFDYHTPRRLLTRDIANQYAQSYRDTVDYFKAAGVRTANMSWGWTLKEVEGVLESNGVTDPDERKARTAEIFGILKDGLYGALESAPEILFITAAGNSDSDIEFDEIIPSNFKLPNLMVVAAVDQAGDPTSFTSTGSNVVIYANGFEVDSYVPGGGRMKASGTSMASPNALNLAAKLFVLDPDLSPTDVINLITEGATRNAGDENILLIHPVNSVSLLKQMRAATE